MRSYRSSFSRKRQAVMPRFLDRFVERRTASRDVFNEIFAKVFLKIAVWRDRTVPSSKKQCRGRKRVNHCHFRGVISTAGIPFLANHTCVQLHLRPPRKHRDRFTAVISLCRCSDSLLLSRRFFPESHDDRKFSTRELQRFRRDRRSLLVEETGRSLPESKARGWKICNEWENSFRDRSMSSCQGYVRSVGANERRSARQSRDVPTSSSSSSRS